ncbi:AI-2E family transporter [Ornithinimicrobium avium]|uniref:AI-2E family transporter n=2 Tax=Ornithinimicrobium avium TaxID=2283195 RepID=A0A345NS62_9MICO|nr:AI-2E family transporter [Ornithinimicrobium avium]
MSGGTDPADLDGDDRPPGRPEPRPDPDAPEGVVDRGPLILQGLRGAASWAWRFLLIAAALAVLFYVVGKLWVGVLPLILALIVSTVLWPPVRWLRRHRWPAGVGAATVLLLALGIFVGSLAAIAPSVVNQGQLIVRQASQGLQIVHDWLSGPPLNLESAQVNEYVDRATQWLQEQSSNIASGVLSGVSTAGSVLVTLALVLVLTFFFLKDGDRFLPWLRRSVGASAGIHLTEALARMWTTLGGFIRAQALVSLVDAVFIGLGLLLLGVPMAFALALITFFAGFIPIVGAVTAGALAVLVALVSSGFMTAVWVLVIVLAVQQLEGNVLTPLLQSRSMDLHPGIILLAVAAGGTRWGIVGAFLAVPVTATAVSLLRYASEQLDLRTGRRRADEVHPLTDQGRRAALLAEEQAPVVQMRAREAHDRVEQERGAAHAAEGTDHHAARRTASLRGRVVGPMGLMVQRRRHRDTEDGQPQDGQPQDADTTRT